MASSSDYDLKRDPRLHALEQVIRELRPDWPKRIARAYIYRYTLNWQSDIISRNDSRDYDHKYAEGEVLPEYAEGEVLPESVLRLTDIEKALVDNSFRLLFT